MANLIQEKETRERLLRNVKKECKQLMEVAVTKKFINEDNGCITSLCATIESCLLHGVKRSVMGLFKTITTMTLLQKISKTCDEAKLILQMCDDYEKAYCSSGSSNQAQSFQSQSPVSSTKLNFSSSPNRQQQQQQTGVLTKNLFSNPNDTSLGPPQMLNGRSFSPTYYKGSSCYKLLWIRLALLNKCLIKIIEHLMSNASKYYMEYAIIADPVDGPIFASLLIGPCALEYTRMKSCDVLWADPNADELIQRHKMHSSGRLGSSIQYQNNSGFDRFGSHTSLNSASGSSSKLLGLNGSVIAKRKASISATMFDESLVLNPINGTFGSISPRERESLPPLTPSFLANSTPPPTTVSLTANSAKEYVESLHQNSKSQLIYGKNHVIVSQKDTQFPGYLSLHSNSNGLVLKWTPNQLMSFTTSSAEQFVPSKPKSGGGYWDYALNIDINTIVYLHCHQSSSPMPLIQAKPDNHVTNRVHLPPLPLTGTSMGGASIVLVGQDGVQHPPIRFPKGSHLLQFLTCLEAGLAPDGALDPPLHTEFGKGKVFPRLQRRSTKKRELLALTPKSENDAKDEPNKTSPTTISDIVEEEQEGDFVFRIINSRAHVTVTTVMNENPKKLEFSISMQPSCDTGTCRLPSIDSAADLQQFSSSNNLIESIFPKKKPKLNSIFSWQPSPKAKPTGNVTWNSSLESNNTSSAASISPKTHRHAERTDSVKSAPVTYSSSNTMPFFKAKNDLLFSSIGFENTASLVYSKNEIDPANELPETYSPSIIRSSLKTLCEDMRRQILSRAFYGWLAYHRQIKTINLHLIGLINCDKNAIPEEEDNEDEEDDDDDDERVNQDKTNIEQEIEMIEKLLSVDESPTEFVSQKSLNKLCEWYLTNKKKLDSKLWLRLTADKNGKTSLLRNKAYFYKIVYFNGIEHKLRKEIWPFLLEHYTINMNKEERTKKDMANKELYERLMDEWKPFEEYVKTRDIKQSFESSSTLVTFPKTPNNSPNLTAIKIQQNQYPNISPPAFVKSNYTSNTAEMKANNTTSFFSFNLLKSKTSKPLIRKDSSISNEVFVSDDKLDSITPASSSFLTKFSRNFLSKLMHKNLDQSMTIDEDDKNTKDSDEKSTTEKSAEPKLNETEDETRRVAHEIVTNVLNKVVEEMSSPAKSAANIDEDNVQTAKLTQTSSNLSTYDDCVESLNTVNTPTSVVDSVRALTAVGVRSDTQSSIDDIYHDIETDYSNDVTVDNLAEQATQKANKPEQANCLLVSGAVGTKRKSISNQDLVESFGLQMHRIDKDVTRCDRNYSYFVSNVNLKKLKNIMYTYVWENLNIGYIQGMCDLVAPLLVIFDNEPMAYSCFKQLMKRMSSNFPHGTAMDQHFANMRTLIQIVDSDLFEHMHHRGDYTHFYFSYRWFLLDFKRELVYDDTFAVWETIWAAKYVCSAHFHLFIALALVETYRDIIIENNMDFTDIIKFFNEMAEKHNIIQILDLARNLIQQIQNLIDNKNDARF